MSKKISPLFLTRGVPVHMKLNYYINALKSQKEKF